MYGPHITFFGNLTRDPALKYTPNQGTPYVQVGVATNTYRGPDEPEQTHFFEATLWRRQAISIARSCQKGQEVFMSGLYSTREYSRRDGSTGIAYQVNVKEFRPISRGAGRNETEREPEDTDQDPAGSQDPAGPAGKRRTRADGGNTGTPGTKARTSRKTGKRTGKTTGKTTGRPGPGPGRKALLRTQGPEEARAPGATPGGRNINLHRYTYGQPDNWGIRDTPR